MDRYKNLAGKLLRYGYTTGSCATGAAKAACLMLFAPDSPDLTEITIALPDGSDLCLPLAKVQRQKESVTCAVQKDGGDDPDVTDGYNIYATVSPLPPAPPSALAKAPGENIVIVGGEGVGRVTKAGLDQPVGEAAINSVPRRMIKAAVAEALALTGAQQGVKVVISVPGGEELAAKTFNPRLGITGGISIIGTTGLVEPMSAAAIRDTIRLEIAQLAARGSDQLLLVPGNYGRDFARDHLHLDLKDLVVCSNWLGDALDTAASQGIEKILLVGHIGKLVKLGLGMPNTHSDYGDGRMEMLVFAALQAGADLDTLQAVSHCVMTDAALLILERAGYLAASMAILGERIQAFLDRRLPGSVQAAFICFTKSPDLGQGILSQSPDAEELRKLWEL